MTETTPAAVRRRSLGVRGKILAVGAAGMASAIVVGGFALSGLTGAGDSLSTVNALNGALDHAQNIEMFNADVSGWEIAYAWDARRIGPAAAVAPDSENRK